MSIGGNLKQLHQQIAKACQLADRATGDVRLLAASKRTDAQGVQTAIHAGQLLFGENQAQALRDKFDVVQPSYPQSEWHFIGHLQKNKVNKCLGLFDAIDSVDSYKIAKKINTSSKNMGITTECLLEINTSNEPQKWGFLPQVSEDILSCFQLNNIKIVGLMTIGPNTKSQKDIRKSFILLRGLLNKINKELGENLLKHLSMGMTGDYEIGVEEGSTMIRVGTGLFGQRVY